MSRPSTGGPDDLHGSGGTRTDGAAAPADIGSQLVKPRGAAPAGSDVEAALLSADSLGGSGDHLSPIAQLAAFKKTTAELNVLLARRNSPRSRRTAVHGYYTRQNELIDSLLETEQIHRGSYTIDGAGEATHVRRALNLSFAANCILLAVRTAIAVVAGSLSLAVATLDAVLDVISSACLYYTTFAASRRDKYAYPVGKERMEPLGIIVFSTVMGTAAFTVVVESIKALVNGASSDMPHVEWVVGGTLGVVAMKLALYFYCRGSTSAAVDAFALDHLNDVLVNGVGLAGALMGARVAPAWDPAVAIVLSLWVVWVWGGQAREHILSLVGQAAPPSLLQKLTFLTYYHDPRLLFIDTVRAFSFGSSSFIAEVDIVLPPDMALREAHEIGESLQFKLELLPEVARAYVHLDWETTHRPEH